jgi:hypothetical protein
MSRGRFWLLAAVFAGGGVVTGAIVGPMLSSPPNSVHMAAMWANNYSSLGEMRGSVDAVVMTTVLRTRPGRTVMTSFGKNVLPFTLVDLRIDEVLRGDVPKRITLEQTGGARDGLAYFANDGGDYEVGSKQLLFLNRQPDTNYFYLASPQGRFHVHADRLTAAVLDEPLAVEISGRNVASMRRAIRLDQ